MAPADSAVLRHRTRHAERLQTFTDDCRRFRRVGHAALNGERHAQRVRPHGVFKRDGLHAFDDRFHVNALGQAEVARIFEGAEIVFFQKRQDFVHAFLFAFKQHFVSHLRFPPSYSSRGSMYFAALSKRPYWPMFFSYASLGCMP